MPCGGIVGSEAAPAPAGAYAAAARARSPFIPSRRFIVVMLLGRILRFSAGPACGRENWSGSLVCGRTLWRSLSRSSNDNDKEPYAERPRGRVPPPERACHSRGAAV